MLSPALTPLAALQQVDSARKIPIEILCAMLWPLGAWAKPAAGPRILGASYGLDAGSADFFDEG